MTQYSVERAELKELIKREGNLKEFVHNGFNCKIVRVHPESTGHLCGYVKIPISHKLYGMSYDDIEILYDYEVPSHAGLTFSGSIKEEGYWIGFDCAHAGDLLPCSHGGYFEMSIMHGDVYRDMEFVEARLKELVDFIKE